MHCECIVAVVLANVLTLQCNVNFICFCACVRVILYMHMYGYVLCLVGAGIGKGDTYQRVHVYDGSKAVGTVDYLVFKAVYLPLSIQCDHHTTPQGLCPHVPIYVCRTYF